MASLGSFKATEQDTSQSSTLPLGNYKLEVSASEVKRTKADTGTILNVTIDVLEPEQFASRKIFTSYNIENQNPVAEKIGKDDLAKLCRAIGLESDPDDSEELHFKSFVAKVGLEKPQPGYDPRNKIVRYYYPDVDGDVPEPGLLAEPAGTKRPAPAPANENNRASAPAAGGKKTPWGAKK